MTTPTTPETTGYQPNQAQLQRVAARRRFNWLYVYTPIIIAGLIALLLVGLLIWGVFSGKVTGTREFASGLADIIIIFTITPLLLLCAIPPGLAVAYVVYQNQTRESRPAHGRLPRMLWQLDDLIDRFHLRLGTVFSRVVRPLISLHAWAAYLQAFLIQVRRIVNWK